MKVFLGGTMNNSTWRDELILGLKIDFFNPIVDVWDEKAQLNEIKEKNACDFLLFVITPLMTGVYSIAEVVDASIVFYLMFVPFCKIILGLLLLFLSE